MVTCLGDMFYPEVGVSIVRLLRGLGVSVDFPMGQTCCGLPLYNSGYHGKAATVAARTIPIFRDSGQVVVPSGSCAWMVKHEYPGLMRDAALRRDAEALAGRTYELSQFLVKVLGKTRFTSAVRGRVTYHDSCHLLRGLHESASPRAILRNLQGVEFVELPGADECCGFGAVFDRGALVETLQQVGVFLEAWHARDSEFGGVINFITGPSRTADIELTLTRGVHGPKEVHAIFVDAPLGGGEPARHG